ncbi:fibronectin type III domain-containing protein, partial [Aeromicrobium sp.]|uniref:fibronectin type III domain-containing protein n=1 Tax=Aeromicrobium sp. TaxID=1871063 RepID=UPI0019842B69
FAGSWNLYIATTYDRGLTWNTVQATPDSDPVQKGCISLGGGSNVCRNLLDFMGSTVDKQGRVLIGYADGCDDSCAAGGKNNHGSHASIARQSSGDGLFAAAGTTPVTPVSASPSASTSASTTSTTATVANGKGIALSWVSPSSNGGSAITGYRVYRDGVPLTTVSRTTYRDTSTTSGTAYSHAVSAVNAVGESANSSTATATAK